MREANDPQDSPPPEDPRPPEGAYEPPAVVHSLPFENAVLAQPACIDGICDTIEPNCP